MGSRFVFLHIMKTAGTSLSKELKRIYGNKYFLDLTFRNDRRGQGTLRINESDVIYPSGYKNCCVLHGHFTINKYRHLNWPIFTFLRNPIKRVESHYNSNRIYMLENMRAQLDFETFCKKTSNTMTHMTGGDLSKFIFVGIVEHYNESLRRLEKLLNCKFRLGIVENKTRAKIPLTKGQIKIVKKYNKEDIHLYKKALKIFKEKR